MAASFKDLVVKMSKTVPFGSRTILPYMSALYNVKYQGNEQKLSSPHARACQDAVGNATLLKEAVSTMFAKASELGHDKVMETYKSATDQILLWLHDDCCFQTDYPRYSLVKAMTNYVVEKGASSLIDPYAGIGYFATAAPTVDFHGYTDNHDYKLIGEILQDAFACTSAHMDDQIINVKSMVDAEGLVTVLPVDFGAGDENYMKVADQYIDLFENYIFARKGLKAAAVVMNWHVLMDSEFIPIRKKLVETGALDRILCFRQWEFYKDSPATCVIFMDFTTRHTVFKIYDFDAMEDAHSCTFLRSKNNYDLFQKATDACITTVPYTSIPDKIYCLHQGLYDYSDVELEPGQELVPLEQLGTFDVADQMDHNSTASRYISPLQLSTVLNNIQLPIKPQKINKFVITYTTSGLRLAFTYAHDIQVAQIKEDTKYAVDHLIYTMRVNEDRISPEYLAHVLLTDRSLSNLLYCMTDKGINRVSPFILGKRCIPIWTDLSKQASVIETLLKVKKINVVWADENIDSLITASVENQMRRKGIVLLDKARNFEELKKTVMDSISSGDNSRRIDAIILDPMIKINGNSSKEQLPGLQAFLSMRQYVKEGKWNCPLFLYTSLEDKYLEKFYNNPLFSKYKQLNHIFHKSGAKTLNLFNKIKEELSDAEEINLQERERYLPEYAAAQCVDELLGTRSVELITSSKDPDQYVGNNIGYDPIRVVVHGIMENLQERGFVPSSLQPGAVTQLLADGEYLDKNGVLYQIPRDILDSLIPKELSLSLKYFTQMVNLAVHGMELSREFRNILISIMSQTELWFYELSRRSDEDLDPFVESWMMRSDFAFQPFEGVVMRSIVGDKDYWYCENVHLQYRPGLAEGKHIMINSVVEEKQKVHVGEHDIVWYCRSKDYEII